MKLAESQTWQENIGQNSLHYATHDNNIRRRKQNRLLNKCARYACWLRRTQKQNARVCLVSKVFDVVQMLFIGMNYIQN